MGAIFNALGNFGSELGQAKTDATKFKNEDALSKLDILAKQLGLDEGQLRLKQMREQIESQELKEAVLTDEGAKKYLKEKVGMQNPTEADVRRFRNTAQGFTGVDYNTMKQDADGNWFVLNRDDNSLIPVTAPAGTKFTPGKIPVAHQDGMIYSSLSNKKPQKIWYNGRLVGEGDEDWPKVKDTFDAAMKDWQEAQTEKPKNEWTLLGEALAGDTKAKAIVDEHQRRLLEIAAAHGSAYATERAQFMFGTWLNRATGEIMPLSNYDARQRIAEGDDMVQTGDIPLTTVIPLQRTVTESIPALKQGYANISSFDNPSDRAIFANILREIKPAAYGEEATWMHNLLGQALTAGLSPQGLQEAYALQRLADTIGTLRQALGLPATDTMMRLAVQLIPSGTTPDSKAAKLKMDIVSDMISQAVNIPALKGASGGEFPGPTLPPTPGQKSTAPKVPPGTYPAIINGKTVGYATPEQKARGQYTPFPTGGNQ